MLSYRTLIVSIRYCCCLFVRCLLWLGRWFALLSLPPPAPPFKLVILRILEQRLTRPSVFLPDKHSSCFWKLFVSIFWEDTQFVILMTVGDWDLDLNFFYCLCSFIYTHICILSVRLFTEGLRLGRHWSKNYGIQWLQRDHLYQYYVGLSISKEILGSAKCWKISFISNQRLDSKMRGGWQKFSHSWLESSWEDFKLLDTRMAVEGRSTASSLERHRGRLPYLREVIVLRMSVSFFPLRRGHNTSTRYKGTNGNSSTMCNYRLTSRDFKSRIPFVAYIFLYHSTRATNICELHLNCGNGSKP